MARYLAAHEGVLFSDPKEPHRFGSDLRIQTPFRDDSKYRALFAQAGSRMTGEGSVFYLLSAVAAREIADSNPDTKLIAMLRNPVDVMYSLYWNNLRDGRHEDLKTFKEALEAEPGRAEGRGVPKTCTWPDALRYREIVRYARQLQRFLDVFPPDSLHVVLFDDFHQSPSQAYADVLRFLQLPPPRVTLPFGQVNQNRVWRSDLARDIRAGRRLPIVRKAASRLLSEEAKTSLSRFSHKVLTRPQGRPPLDAEFRAALLKEYEEDIRSLESLLRRKVGWLSPAS